MPLSPRSLSGYYPWAEFQAALGNTWSRIVTADRDRVTISFTQVQGIATPIWFSTANHGSTQQGISLASTTSILTFNYATYGPMVGAEWWGLAPGGANTITVFTTRFLEQLETDNALPAIHQPAIASEYSTNGDTLKPGQNFADAFSDRWRGCISSIQARGFGSVGNTDSGEYGPNSAKQAVAWKPSNWPIMDR